MYQSNHRNDYYPDFQTDHLDKRHRLSVCPLSKAPRLNATMDPSSLWKHLQSFHRPQSGYLNEIMRPSQESSDAHPFACACTKPTQAPADHVV